MSFLHVRETCVSELRFFQNFKKPKAMPSDFHRCALLWQCNDNDKAKVGGKESIPTSNPIDRFLLHRFESRYINNVTACRTRITNRRYHRGRFHSKQERRLAARSEQRPASVIQWRLFYMRLLNTNKTFRGFCYLLISVFVHDSFAEDTNESCTCRLPPQKRQCHGDSMAADPISPTRLQWLPQNINSLKEAVSRLLT